MTRNSTRRDNGADRTALGHANVVVRPPVLWISLMAAGLGLDLLLPLPFMPVGFPAAWVGGGIWLAGFGLAALAIGELRRGGTEVRTNRPTAAIVHTGLYAFSRNPIYVGAHIAAVGVAIAFDSLWILMTLAPFYLVIRHGVVAREEAYLERKFSDVYLAYKARVRRWF